MSEEAAKQAVKKTKAEKAVAGVEKIVIDADGCTMGRVAAYAAKQAINGKKVIIFNVEKAVISGKYESIYADRKKRNDAKSYINPRRFGPHWPKNPDRYFRRVIRGMLPWDQPKGKKAFKNVMTYIGRPEREIMRREHIDIAKAKHEDSSRFRKHYDYFVTLADLCGYLGGRTE